MDYRHHLRFEQAVFFISSVMLHGTTLLHHLPLANSVTEIGQEVPPFQTIVLVPTHGIIKTSIKTIIL